MTTFRTLLAVLVGQTATMAPLLLGLLELVGPLELLEFGGHFVLLGLYTLLHSAAEAGGSRGGRHSDFFVVSALDALGSGLEAAEAEAAAAVGREVEVEEEETPWWRRPPRTWPPRIDDFEEAFKQQKEFLAPSRDKRSNRRASPLPTSELRSEPCCV